MNLADVRLGNRTSVLLPANSVFSFRLRGTAATIAQFATRMAGFAVVVPGAYMLTALLCPNNFTCSEPVLATFYAVLLGMASATSSMLEERFVPKRTWPNDHK